MHTWSWMATWLPHSGHSRFGQRGRHVHHVLVHLGGHGGVETRVRHRKRERVALAELHVRQRTARRDSEHVRAWIDALHESLGPDQLSHLRGEVPGAAADVEHPLTRLQIERLEGGPALPHDVVRRVQRVDCARAFLVECERQLLFHAHRA